MNSARAKTWLAPSQKYLIPLYVISLATSMSGMEIFSSVIALIMVVYFVVARPKKSSWELPPFGIPILIFIAVAILGILLGPAPFKEQIGDIRRMRFFCLYFILFYQLSLFPKDRRWLTVLLCVCAVMIPYGFLEHFIGVDWVRPAGKKIISYAIPETHTGPLVLGTFNHHLTFSNVFSFYACLLTAVGVYMRRKWYTAVGVLCFLLCVWSQSRAAWMALPLAVAILASARSVKAVGAVVVAAAILFGALYQFDQGFHERFERTFLKQDEFYNFGPRRALWSIQWEMFKEKPLLGVGFNNNERYCREYMDRFYPKESFCGHAHSTPLQILATTGIFGTLAFVWLWFAVFARLVAALKFYRRETWEHWIAFGLFAAFVSFLLQGITQWNFGDAEVIHNVIFFWAVIASIPIPKRIPTR